VNKSIADWSRIKHNKDCRDCKGCYSCWFGSTGKWPFTKL